MKIVTILGARPQFIKAAAVNRAIKKHNTAKSSSFSQADLLNEVIVHTGQHYDENMSDVFFDQMQISRPNYNLNIRNLSHGAMTGQMLEKIEEVLLEEKPDLVLVYGDTNSTLAGALAARKLNFKIAHVEAGLRNYDFSIPEDVNRVLTDRLSDILFVPTTVAMENLKNEGFLSFSCEIVKTGDIMADNVFFYSAIAEKTSKILDKYNLKRCPFILCTIHRASNTTPDNLAVIVDALNEIACEQQIILPLHPRTKQALNKCGLAFHSEIITLDPVSYFDMLQLLKAASMVITDSGGLQKEAYLLKKQSLLLMEYTPWEELVKNGFSRTTIINKINILTEFKNIYELTPDFSLNLYGDGHTADAIVNYVHSYLLRGR